MVSDAAGREFPTGSWLIWGAAGVGAMHFAMSYRLAYHDRGASIRRHPIALLYGPVLLFALIAVGVVGAIAGSTTAADALRSSVTIVFLLTMLLPGRTRAQRLQRPDLAPRTVGTAPDLRRRGMRRAVPHPLRLHAAPTRDSRRDRTGNMATRTVRVPQPPPLPDRRHRVPIRRRTGPRSVRSSTTANVTGAADLPSPPGAVGRCVE